MFFPKKLIAAAVLMSCTAAFAGQPTVPDLRIQAEWNKPHNDENWDDGGVGFTAQALFWQPNDFAIGASLGMQSVDANSSPETFGNVTGELSGDARIIYLGVSAIQQIPLQNNMSVQGEAGLRYAKVNSDVDITYRSGTSSVTDDVDMEHAFLGLLAVDLMMKANPQLNLFGGLGVQTEFDKGDAKAFGRKDKNTIGSAFLRLGAQMSF